MLPYRNTGVAAPCLTGFLFFLFPLLLSAQPGNIIFSSLTIKDGLLSNQVNSITQDENGFIWIGTEEGLQKYDGTRFTTYRQDLFNSNSLSSNHIDGLYTENGHIWISTDGGGINLFNTKNNRFTHFNTSTDSSHPSGFDRADRFYKDRHGQLWVSTLGGIYYYDSGQNRLRAPEWLKGVADGADPIKRIAQDTTGNYWMVSSKGVLCYDIHTKQLYTHAGNPGLLPDIRYCFQLFMDKDNTCWIGSWDFLLYHYTIGTHQLERYPVKSEATALPPSIGNVSSMFRDAGGNFWYTSFELGLFRYDSLAGNFIQYRHSNEDSYSLISDKVNCSFTDRDNNIWVGTENGISICNPGLQKITVLDHGHSPSGYFPESDIIAFANDKEGNYWLGFGKPGGGLYKFSSGFILKKKYDLDSDRELINGYPANYFRALVTDKQGRLFMSVNRDRFGYYDPVADKLVLKKLERPDMQLINKLYFDRDGILWAATWGAGLAKYNTGSGECRYYAVKGTKEDDYENNVRNVYEDAGGDFWVATNHSGLAKFDRHAQQYTAIYLPDPNNPDAIADNTIISMYGDDETGQIYLATYNGGLNIFNKNTGRFKKITTREGLPSNCIQGIVKDDFHNLWITTSNGLCRYNPNTHTVINITDVNVISGNRYPSNRVFKAADGRIVIPTANRKLVFIDPSLWNTHKQPPDVVLTDFREFSNTVNPDPVVQQDQAIRLTYNQNFISFYFTSLEYLHAASTCYYYKLQGVDSNWVNNKHQGFASYTNLDPGDYVFSVKAVNDEGAESRHITRIALHISKPFWARSWFIAMAAALVFCLVYILYRYRLHQAIKFFRLRNKISTDLHDDIGSTLSSINIYSEVARQKIKSRDGSDITPILTRITESSANVMENMQNIVWAINPKNDELENILVHMQVFATQVLEPKNIRVVFKTGVNSDHARLDMEKRRDLFLLFKEAINNIARHANAATATIFLGREGKQLMLHIEDDGTGFDTGKASSGNGLKNMTARAAQMGGTISIVSGNGEGTAVHVTLRI